MSRALASARTATSLPVESPGRIAFQRLWPIGVFALVSAGLAWIWPQVAAVGAGYAILVALAWRRRDEAVTAIEERDGVRFYVEPSSAFSPVRLVRTPGLTRDRAPAGHPPPPPPRRSDDVGAGAGREGGDGGERQRGARARGLREPARDRAADRRRAQEDRRVERHHAAAHRGLGGELQARRWRRRRRRRSRRRGAPGSMAAIARVGASGGDRRQRAEARGRRRTR